MKNKNMNSYL